MYFNASFQKKQAVKSEKTENFQKKEKNGKNRFVSAF